MMVSISVLAIEVTPTVNDQTQEVFPFQPVKVFIHPEKNYSFDDIIKLDSTLFDSSYTSLINLGFQPGEAWFKLEVNMNTHLDKYLVLRQPTLGRVNFFMVSDGQLVAQDSSGSWIHILSRGVPTSYPIFRLPASKSIVSVYLRIQSDEPMMVPLQLLSEEKMIWDGQLALAKNFLLQGGILFLTIFNIVLLVAFKDRIYLYYGLFTFTILLVILKTNGYLSTFILGDYNFLLKYSGLMECFNAIAGAVFTIHFLQLKKHLPGIYRFIIFQIAYLIVSLFIGLAGYNQLAIILFELSAFVFIFLALYASVRVYLMGFKPARFYILSWGVFLAGVLSFLLLNAGLMEYSILNVNLINIAIAFEMLFTSFAVADRIIILRKEKERETREKMDLLNSQNERLEAKVSRRTADLEATNQELKKQNHELSRQKKLVIDLNATLEEKVMQRTAELEKQYIKLEEYAFLNAHKVRGPLARILGLITVHYLTENSKPEESAFYLKKIEENAKELDHIIRTIGQQVKEDINNQT